MGFFRYHTRRTVVQPFNKSVVARDKNNIHEEYHRHFFANNGEVDSDSNMKYAEEDITLKDKLEIPGFWRLYSTRESKNLKIIWIAVFGLCSTMFAYQTWDRVQMIWSVPKSAKVKLDFENSLDFPSFTICPGYAMRYSVIKKVQTEFDSSGCISGQKYCDWGLPWRMATHTETIIKSCKFQGKDCLPGTEQTGKWGRRLTSLGRCFTYSSIVNFVMTRELRIGLVMTRNQKFKTYLGEPITRGGNSNALEVTVDPVLWDRYGDLLFNGIRVYIHNPSEVPLVEISGINVNKGCTAHYALKVKEYWRVNDVPYHPCSSDRNYTQSRCVMKCIYDSTRLMSNSSCGSPFMTEFDVSLCRTRKEISFFTENFQYLIYNGSMWNRCVRSCPALCKERTYTPITSSLGLGRQNESEIALRVYFADMWVERITEEWMYNWDEFVSDTGGNLNLFLGASCYTFIQLLEYCAAVLIEKIKQFL